MDKQTAFPKRQIVDIETWERKDNFNFFRNFLNPCITITSEVECTVAKERAVLLYTLFIRHLAGGKRD